MKNCNKKTITIIFPFYSTNKGSFSPRLHEFAKYLTQKGWRVNVITSSYFKSDLTKPKYLFSKEVIDTINVISVNTPHGNDKKLITRGINSILFAFISSIILLFKKDKYILSSIGPITNGLPLIVSKLLFKKRIHILEIRDLWPYAAFDFGLITNNFLKKILLKLEKVIYSQTDRIVTLSPGQTNFLRSKHPEHFSKFYTSSQISDNELFKNPLSKGKETDKFKPYLIYYGGMGPIHNVSFWINTFGKSLKDQNEINVLIFGDGPDKKKLENKAKGISAHNIFFMGNVPKKELVIWIINSEATLFSTTHHECQQHCSPNKIYDSFAAGKPIIQNSKGWIFNLVEEAKCGLNLNDENSIDEINSYLKDKTMMTEHKKNSKYLGEKEYEKKLVFERYEKYIFG